RLQRPPCREVDSTIDSTSHWPLGPTRPMQEPGHARTAMDVWRIEYNMVRPHQVLDREVRQPKRF
ncbi:MAG: transposase, partial [Actinobacteria bacterium]|nr:transposase [Actinomycetota bacterium]